MTTVRRKQHFYAPYVAEMRDMGAHYCVAAITCYGRMGYEARQFAEALARRVAAHRGLPSRQEIQFRIEGKIAVAVRERAARMTRFCLQMTASIGAEDDLEPGWAEPGLLEGLEALMAVP